MHVNNMADGRIPCKVCGRQFIPESLEKHQPICKRNAQSKRKVFDMAKQRAEGTDISLKQIRKAQKTTVAAPKSNWKVHHEQFIANIRNARGVQHAIDAGEPLPPPPPPTIDPDYIQCPYCSRRFNEKAAERHINFCKEQSKRINMKPIPDATAKARMSTRTQYQVPKPKTKTAASPGTTNPGPTNPGPPKPGPIGASRTPGSGPAGTPSSRAAPGASRSTAGRAPPASRGRTTGPYAALDYEIHNGVDTNPPPFKTQQKYRSTNTNQELRSEKPEPRQLRSKSTNTKRVTSATRVDAKDIGNRTNYNTTRYLDTDLHIHRAESEDLGSTSYHTSSTPYHSSSSKFCHECGVVYPIVTAKFCSECGIRRLKIS